ncbi:tyrosine-type recombinase/integrase [Thiomicrorhabdus indica]|uniref:tyrosine-type recombinase/integrase n=1 Tax=Thiomicrorhabdus indica TaxID=2267253 RepID=UPI002AA8F4D0|nr:tyrosine-type recombinase/integrase [Thiomicrorhabdus indica]
MSSMVFNALKAHFDSRTHRTELVFPVSNGEPIHAGNFLKRIWKPLLSHLNIPYRKPYQMRHTAATLWLSAGENPNWIANQLGHASTQMLFTVYARFVPNLTHKDGSAMEKLMAAQVNGFHSAVSEPAEDMTIHVDEKPQEECEAQQESAFWDQIIQPNAMRS